MKRKLSVLLSIFLCVALCISTLGLAADSTGEGEPAATGAPEDAALPEGGYRIACGAAALGCAALAVAGCIVWTPVRYETIYGFQGRYLLPALPLALLAFGPRRIQVTDGARAAAQLTAALCVANAGVLLNAMLAVIAR